MKKEIEPWISRDGKSWIENVGGIIYEVTVDGEWMLFRETGNLPEDYNEDEIVRNGHIASPKDRAYQAGKWEIVFDMDGHPLPHYEEIYEEYRREKYE